MNGFMNEAYELLENIGEVPWWIRKLIYSKIKLSNKNERGETSLRRFLCYICFKDMDMASSCILHHKDGNHTNVNPDNLVLIFDDPSSKLKHHNKLHKNLKDSIIKKYSDKIFKICDLQNEQILNQKVFDDLCNIIRVEYINALKNYDYDDLYCVKIEDYI